MINIIIDLNIVAENYRYLKTLTNSKVGAVIKYDAYGFGATKISKILYHKCACNDFFTFNIDEAIKIRNVLEENNVNIYSFLGPYSEEECLQCYNYNIIPILNNLYQITQWQKFHTQFPKRMTCILNVDSGMNRLGINSKEWQNLINSNIIKDLKVKYIMSHLSCSEDKNHQYNQIQLENFHQYINSWPYKNTKASLAASSAILNLSSKFHFDLVRPGIALYEDPLEKYENIKSPITVTTTIVGINKISRKSSVGYKRTYYAQKGDIIATVPFGYADSHFRASDRNGIVLIENYQAKIIGQISMDLITIDVSHIPGNIIFIGQTVKILCDKLPLSKIAKASNIKTYELLVNLLSKSRSKKQYINAE